MSRTWAVLIASCLFAVSLTLGAACGSDDGDGHHDNTDGHHDNTDGHHDDHEGGHSHGDPVGPPSGADCPDGSTLTYENFGKEFFSTYCLRCHSSKVTGNARMGAPTDHNFDTFDEIDLMADHIDQTAAFGPDNENEKMPISGTKPSDEERRKLGEWLACGLPE